MKFLMSAVIALGVAAPPGPAMWSLKTAMASP